MVFTEEQQRRHDDTMNALLHFTNANLASCIYFEPPIDSERKKAEGLRIAQDLWESDEMVRRFLSLKNDRFAGADYDLAASWTTVIKGPLFLMEVHGNKALFMCEGYVFEVYSIARPWSEMRLFLPDMVMTTIVPFDGVLTTDGFLLRHDCPMEGSGLIRIRAEFEVGKTAGIISTPCEFRKAARSIEKLRKEKGLDPASYFCSVEMIDYLNEATSSTCFPYEYAPRMRDWDGCPIDLSR